MKKIAMISALMVSASMASAGMLTEMVGETCADVEWVSDALYYDTENGEVRLLGERVPIEVDKLGNEYPESIYQTDSGEIISVIYNPHEECYWVKHSEGKLKVQAK